MGLESVEFILDVERSFEVSVRESEITRHQTVREFAHLVFSKQKLPPRHLTEDDAEREVLRLLEKNAPRWKKTPQITPDTPLFAIFTERR